jgi:hypothetical protein
MSSYSFWSDACKRAVGQPLQAHLDAAYASCSVTVRSDEPALLRLLLLLLLLHSFLFCL